MVDIIVERAALGTAQRDDGRRKGHTYATIFNVRISFLRKSVICSM